MIALPVFGYKSHISIDRRYGFIRAGEVTSAAHADGRMLRHVIAENSSSEVWADTAYRSRANETRLADRMLFVTATPKSLLKGLCRPLLSVHEYPIDRAISPPKNNIFPFIQAKHVQRSHDYRARNPVRRIRHATLACFQT